jgi:hypothetical protein
MLKSRIPWGLALVVERLSGASSIALVLYGFCFSLLLLQQGNEAKQVPARTKI